MARATGIPQPTVTREVARLLEAELLTATRRGRINLVVPNRELAYFPDLRDLIIKAAGPPYVLARMLRPLTGIDAAYIYGSWARRYHGEVGEYPSDIDVLIIGDPDVDEVYDALLEAESELRIDVNPTIVSKEEWRHPNTVFLKTVAEEPLVPVLEP